MSRARRIAPVSSALFLALIVNLALGSTAVAASGDLDLRFGQGGRVMTSFSGNAFGRSIAIQADGRIVMAGTVEPSDGASRFGLARYGTDGALDPTFGADGKVTTRFAGFGASDPSIVLQSDGKVVAAGTDHLSGENRFVLARYLTDGALDPTFSRDGKQTTGFRGGVTATEAIALQDDGSIVVAGGVFSSTGGTQKFALARYWPNGTLDPNFGGDGKVTTTFGFAGTGPFGGAGISALAVQGNGGIVAVGAANNAATNQSRFALARYLPDGSLDPDFSGDGKLTTRFTAGYAGGGDVALQPDGKIVAVGSVTDRSIERIALARYLADGTLDPAFGSDGKQTTRIAFRVFSESVALEADGKIVVAGSAVRASGAQRFAVARYRDDGTLDPNFSGDGKLTTGFGRRNSGAWAVAVQADGKIVAAGTAWRPRGEYRFALARYES